MRFNHFWLLGAEGPIKEHGDEAVFDEVKAFDRVYFGIAGPGNQCVHNTNGQRRGESNIAGAATVGDAHQGVEDRDPDDDRHDNSDERREIAASHLSNGRSQLSDERRSDNEGC